MQPARSKQDMRPAKVPRTKIVSRSNSKLNKVTEEDEEPHESDEDKLKREIDEDFEQAIFEHMSAIKNEIHDDNGNAYQLVKKKKGPSYNPHARPSAGHHSHGKQWCCINSIEREIAETKSMKVSDGSGKKWERI